MAASRRQACLSSLPGLGDCRLQRNIQKAYSLGKPTQQLQAVISFLLTAVTTIQSTHQSVDVGNGLGNSQGIDSLQFGLSHGLCHEFFLGVSLNSTTQVTTGIVTS
jgi:hypothetical protein